ncbi:aminotransferase class V-fold PLP-dependent enzyme [Pseudooceanicola sp. CBS1P-1]|uniref:Aminotransferase class V-fold PLP-dependent enzyme n=1 Tax=Pseudooceanicola albus TaxID=2692189 RepID=A0A6L7G7Q1_9RHOB|nr:MULTISPECIES: aminotransferase class V-fold PLP-dependent enzyme [Pseudooceanicola]MBT9386001.1 aminotransferase class V-fold PLP-dependent enzyme [Pseudooceanicola endophyticus]MXN19578.1 aminotransferase class V-fold PLP-dependent enzyme [Pseudooceanicola albus]
MADPLSFPAVPEFQTALQRFARSLAGPDLPARLQAGLIGDGMPFETPFGLQNMLYADYVASGRALRQVETFVMEEVLPVYANSHTEASHVGRVITRMREEARGIIADLVGAGPDCHVIFAGNGATGGLNRIVGLLNLRERVAAGEDIRVFIGPYEHHSNILPWRESGARVTEIPEAPGGGVDLAALEAELVAAQGAGLLIGSFSAASNVTGLLTDPDPVTRLLKAHGALAVWDYACGAPYLPMDMKSGTDCAKDAIVFSAHKFPGGPGASGVAVLRDSIVARATPTLPGGGTVSFVSPWTQVYSGRVEAREEAGTPNVVADIRAALVMMVKDAVGTDYIGQREEALRQRALAAWSGLPQLQILGQNAQSHALPVFSFRVFGDKGRVHHQLFTRMLSDHYGVQARGGCACAGPYAHRLLEIDEPASEALMARLAAGEELEKPGWTRLNLSYLHDDAQADRIIAAVRDLAQKAEAMAALYTCDTRTARFNAA